MGSFPVTFRSGATARAPVCWTRVEHNELNFVRTCAEHTDGVVIAARFDGLPPAGSTQASAGALKNEALKARIRFLIDLESSRLPFLEGPEDESFGRDVRTAVARAVALPLTAEALSDDVAAQPIVRAAITAQVGADRTFAPDFFFEAADDPWLKVTLRCLRLTLALGGHRRVAAWIHVSLEAMQRGVLQRVLNDYAAVLPSGSTVAITVSDLTPRLPIETLATYFGALAAFDAAGLHVLVDRASEASIAAVATFASGCMIGTRLYRTAPSTPVWSSELNPRIPVSYLEARRARRLPLKRAQEMNGRGNVTPCAHRDCAALKPNMKNLDVRLHNAHDLRAEIQRSRELGVPALVRWWHNSGLKHQRNWAQALELAHAASEAA